MTEGGRGNESRIKVACIQMEPLIGRKADNVARTLALIERGAGHHLPAGYHLEAGITGPPTGCRGCWPPGGNRVHAAGLDR